MHRINCHFCPVGFEMDRAIKGLKEYPANYVYLLTSSIENQSYSASAAKKKTADIDLVELSKQFTTKLISKIKSETNEVEQIQCSFINYREMLINLCELLERIFKKEKEDVKLGGIWFNVSTATKLFVAAAMVIASFFPDLIHIFYISAGHYTLQLLLDKKRTKEEIESIYREKGETYSTESDLSDYQTMEFPVVPAEKFSPNSKKILKILFESLTPDYKSQSMKLEEIIAKLDPEADTLIEKKNAVSQSKEKNQEIVQKIRTKKMKWHHYFAELIDRRLIREIPQGKIKYYRLTDQGIIVAIIIAKLGDYQKRSFY